MNFRTTILAFALGISAVASTAAAENKIIVTNGNDDGAGSLRTALEFAATQRQASKILIATRDDISLNSPLVYDGTAPLALIGTGQRLIGDAGTDLLTITRGIDLVITGLDMPGLNDADDATVTVQGILIKMEAPLATAIDTPAI